MALFVVALHSISDIFEFNRRDEDDLYCKAESRGQARQESSWNRYNSSNDEISSGTRLIQCCGRI